MEPSIRKTYSIAIPQTDIPLTHNTGMTTDFWGRLKKLTPSMDDAARSKFVQKTCGVSQATASRWKTGGPSGEEGPSPGKVKLLCEKLSASFDYLYYGNELAGKLILVPGSRSEQAALILNDLPEEDQKRAVAVLRAIRGSEPQSS